MSEPATTPPPLPQKVLDYFQPPKQTPAFTAGVILRFAGAFAVAFAVVAAWLGGMTAAVTSVFPSCIAAAVSALILIVTASLRRRAAQTWTPEHSGVMTMFAGAACVVVPVAARSALLGVTETLPWMLTTWFVCCIVASYIISPPRGDGVAS